MVDIRIRDTGTGQFLPPGASGELLIRAPNVALGYFGNEKATRETFVDGWLHTGDAFRADRDELL